MRKKKLLTLATLFILLGGSAMAKNYTVTSPNGKNAATVDDSLSIIVSHSGKTVVTIKARQTYQLFPRWEQIIPMLGIKS